MKSVKKILAGFGMLIVLAFAMPALAGKGGGTAAVTAGEAERLTFLREEEKLARDVYTALHQHWGAPIFGNIASSEQQHFDQVGYMLDKYRLPDPARPDRPGVFVNPELQGLYDQLMTRGQASLLEALRVGGAIEEVDILDLREAVAGTDKADLIQLYDNLMKGSRNHLRAFAGQIENLGVPYAAQYLTQEEVDAIVDSPMERGPAR